MATFDGKTGLPFFLTEKFDEPVLYAPARRNFITPCNSLKIITAFTDCERISTHMIGLSERMKSKALTSKISVDILLGMTKSSLSKKKHEDICRLVRFLCESKDMPNVSCRYICRGSEVHSKVYIWASEEDALVREFPRIAFCGSLNYTSNAFYRRRESVSLCNEFDAMSYYKSLLPDTIDCFDDSVTEKLKNVENVGVPTADDDDFEKDYCSYDKEDPVDVLQVSLLTARYHDVGYGSGVNWGIRKNGTKRNRNQAYIPYNVLEQREGFFPNRSKPEKTRENCPMFKVITKDFGSFHMRMAQANNKALHSVESNAILGEWFRKRLGVPSGGFITRQMLENYGKTYVTFRKYSDGTYLLDF